MKRKLLIGGVVVLLAVSLCACGKEKSESDQNLKDKVDKANEQVKEDENSNEFLYENWENGVAIYKYNGPGGAIEIPEELGGKTVVRINSSTFEGMQSKIESLTVPPCVQEIANGTLETEGTVKIRAYRNTGGMNYALNKGLQYENLGENPIQASAVIIFDETGKESKILKLGDSGTEDFMKGISFEEKDGKSVLILDGCHAGSIIVDEYASLIIELKDGSENVLTAGAGHDGVSVMGNLTITGNGSLTITGSDIYSVGEGDSWWVGYGIYANGDLTIADHANISAKSGKSSKREVFAVMAQSGNLLVDNARLEMMIQESEVGSGAVLVMDDGTGKYGQITVNGCQIVEGGSVVAVMQQSQVWGSSISNAGVINVDDEGGFTGAAQYVRIE